MPGLVWPTTTAAATLTLGQQKCLTNFAKSFAKAAKAGGKSVTTCVKLYGKNRLAAGNSAETCLVADSRGRVAKSKDKISRGFAKRCTSNDLSGTPSRPAIGVRVAAIANTAVTTAAASLSDCDSLDDGSLNASCPDLTFPGTSLRFHPGHYVLNSGQSISQATLDEIANNPDVRGVSNVYDWVSLESAMGVYDFSAIAADLAAVKSINKRLMVMIRDKSFSGNPFLPVPAYMHTPEYSGGYIGADQVGYVAKHWVAAVNARHTALIQALGAAFSDDPFVEVVKTAESATAADVSASAARISTPMSPSPPTPVTRSTTV